LRAPALRRSRDDAAQPHSAARFCGRFLARSGPRPARILPCPAAVAAAAADDLALSRRVPAAGLLAEPLRDRSAGVRCDACRKTAKTAEQIAVALKDRSPAIARAAS